MSGDQIRSDNCSCYSRIAFAICAVLSIIALIVGTVLVPLGISEQKVVNQMNPDEDFTAIEPECEIVGAFLLSSVTKYCENKNSNFPCGCDDEYSYLIYAPQLARLDDYYITHQGDGYKYESRRHKIERPEVKNCDSGSPAAPKWEEGETTACWHPSTPGKGVHKRYECGTDECIKILSPYDEAGDADAHAKALWIGGIVVLCASAISAIVLLSLKKQVFPESCRGGNTATAPRQHSQNFVTPSSNAFQQPVKSQDTSSKDKYSSGGGPILFKK